MYLEPLVRDTATVSGVGNVTLNGTPPTGRQSFNAAYGVGPLFPYLIGAATSAQWEEGEGYLSAATTLVRARVIRNSAGTTALVNFTAGTYDVFSPISTEMANAAMVGSQLLVNKGQGLN